MNRRTSNDDDYEEDREEKDVYELERLKREEDEDDEENTYVSLSYVGYSDSEMNDGCMGHRRDTRCYRFVKSLYWCKPMAINCYNKSRFSFRRYKRNATNLLSETIRYKKLALIVVAYVFLSALCGVLQIRIYKQLLIYAYVHEIVITTVVQCAFILPISISWWCWNKGLSIYREGFKKQHDSSNRGTGAAWSDVTIDVNEDDYNDKNEPEKTKTVSDDNARRKNVYVAPDVFTSSDARFYTCVSLFSFVAGAFKVLPIMILPSMLMILMDQFGLIFMMAISFAYLGRKYDKIQLLCVALVALGVLIEIIPDYEESIGFAKDMSHDFFWRNTIYHDYNASVNHLYHFNDGNAIEGKNTLLFREHFTNGSVFDLSRCLKTQNVSIDADEKYSYSFYQKAIENESLKWWRDNNVAFLICIFLAIFSSFPDCLSYAVMEKFWRMRDAVSQSTSKLRNDRIRSLEVASKIVVFKLIWVTMLWPFFYLPNLHLGGYHYLKYGSYCSFDNLFYDVHGVVTNKTVVGDNSTADARVTSVRLDGDYVNENIGYPGPYPGTMERNVISAYWECSPWRNGIDCQNMLQLTMLYCLLDFVQYVLHVKIIRDTTNANLAWLLGIVRIGISDVIFSIPLIAGVVFSSFRYYDILSLMVITCATLVFWFHKYQGDDDEDNVRYDDKNDDALSKNDDEDMKKLKETIERVKDMCDDREPRSSYESNEQVVDDASSLSTSTKSRKTHIVFTDDEF